MREQTEDDPYAHTPELWQWSSCPFQCCKPSFQHPQFPIYNKNENQVASLYTSRKPPKSTLGMLNHKQYVKINLRLPNHV